mgnify:CR=1 FL=1
MGKDTYKTLRRVAWRLSYFLPYIATGKTPPNHEKYLVLEKLKLKQKPTLSGEPKKNKK